MFARMKTYISRSGNVAVEVVLGIVAVVGVVLGIAAMKSVNVKCDELNTRLNDMGTSVAGIQQLEQDVRQTRNSVALLGQDIQVLKDQLAKKPEPVPQKGGAAVGDKKEGTTTEVAAGPGTSYTIKDRDTLGKIAKQFKTTSDAIQKLNPNLNPNRLKVGSKIRVK